MTSMAHMLAEAQALAGGNTCAAGHHWKFEGGRGCPLDLTDDCSQTVYRCKRCGEYDYGEPGGPGLADCENTCEWKGIAW